MTVENRESNRTDLHSAAAPGHTGKVLSIDDRQRHRDDCVERIFETAVAGDTEFSRVLQNVNEVCTKVQSQGSKPDIVGEALLLALHCAVSRALLARDLSLALTDDLTGLSNRRGFLALAAHQLRIARRTHQSAMLFFADFNNLKQVNDAFGHREGDRALVYAADALRETFRDSDVIARFGGDEFAVLALEASGQTGEAVLNRMADNLAAVNASEPGYEISLSVGSAHFDPQQAVPLEDLIAQADEAMYVQKRARQASA